jgi:tRNA (mo5U34)-methyltransferase
MAFEMLVSELREADFEPWADELVSQSSSWFIHHGDYGRWSHALSMLPEIDGVHGIFDQAAVTVEGHCENQDQLFDALRGLMPWRKGPYQITRVKIDSEWRSDLKWQRLLPHLSSLQNRRILDVGCGNGYHCWRMLDALPRFVLGIEPSVLFNLQFQALQRYLKRSDICLLPIGIESMPAGMNWFDTVFSMGVLYHRKSPIDHLYQLKGLLAPGGELCLETLVIEGGKGEVLVPSDRYARMRNVWFLPSALELASWLQRCGFIDVEIVDVTLTSIDEQRSTQWMQFESLRESLDRNNEAMTVEGLPAPRRAIILARNP